MASISSEVPTELLVQVLVGHLPEDVAIEPRTTSAAPAYWPCNPPPWGEP